jgi:malonyl-CoA O-methyltransferase
LSVNTLHKIDKRLVAESFKASGATYEASALIQKDISRKLIEMLHGTGQSSFRSALEIGCCTGFLTELLCRNFNINELYLNDIVKEFCVDTSMRLGGLKCKPLVFEGDIEARELPQKLDLVISSSTFQWIDDLPGLLHNIYDSLVPGGILAFSIFGNGTMEEISEIRGQGLDYISDVALIECVKEKYSILNVGHEKKQLFFQTVRGILRHIQQTGVGGTGLRKWTHTKFREFEEQYTNKFSTAQGLPVSYSSTYIIARKG